jgi:hypothetical protein
MGENFKNKVSETFKETPADSFGDASLTAKEIGVLKKLLEENKKNKDAVVEHVKRSGMPLPVDEITAEDWARAGAKHACGVTEHLAKKSVRGEEFKEDAYESYTTKNRFDRFIEQHLSEELKKEWKRPLKRDVENSEAPISYPEGVDESKIHGGGLPHRILPAGTIKNLELVRLGRLDKKILGMDGVGKNVELRQLAIEWDKLIPDIQSAKTVIELTKNLMNGIRRELETNGVLEGAINNIIKTGFKMKGLEWEHGEFENYDEYYKEVVESLEIIKEGVVYRHKEGLKYSVDSVNINPADEYEGDIFDVTAYETGKKPILFNILKHSQNELSDYVLYTQLEAGKYPIGQRWVMRKEDFLSNFEESK